jgi:L-Ala-D/L-Glu epimerase
MIGLSIEVRDWALKTPLRISRGVMESIPFVMVTLQDEAGHIGRGEAAGVPYDGETPQTILAMIEATRRRIEAGITRDQLLTMLPPGGGRNAIDCALWDLEAKQSGIPVWQRVGISEMRPLTTAYTIGIGDDAEVAAKAAGAAAYPILKLKADADHHVGLVEIVRQHRPDAKLIVDANQAWTIEQLREVAPRLAALGVALIEQPLRREADGPLMDYCCPIPLAADESCTDSGSLDALVGKYSVASIKLDKCGGLTEALAVVERAQALGFGLMVGCMAGTSLAMAPAAIIGQHCDYVDLDGPLLHIEDREPGLQYDGATMGIPPAALWG